MASSLENQCGVPALVVILNHPLLKQKIFRLHTGDYFLLDRHAALQIAVSEVLKDYHHVLKNFIPKYLAPLIGFEMWKWAKDVNKYFGLSFKFSENFIKSSLFTSIGLIDEEKAARELLNEPSLSIFLKFKIACQYFLEDIIPTFWQVLKGNETNFKKMILEQEHPTPMILWCNYLGRKNSTSNQIQKVVIRRKFKISVFSYGLKVKNIAVVKFCLGSNGNTKESKTEAEIIRRLAYKPFYSYVRKVMNDYLSKGVDYNCLFDSDFLANRNIVFYFISLMSKEELKKFILMCRISYSIFSWLLLWPHQNQFMDFAHIVYENFDVKSYRHLMDQIIDLIDEEDSSDKIYACQSYNYRSLLKQFWIKSPPHLKQQIITLESEGDDIVYNSLISTLFYQKLTAEHFSIINLILKYANSFDREKILLCQGRNIFNKMIFTLSNIRLADSFLKKLDLNQEFLQTFKKDFITCSFNSIMLEKSIKFVEEIFEWAAGNEELDLLKVEIFNRLTVSHEIEYLFTDCRDEITFSFLNKILKWFRKTDEEIEEWKNNIVFSVFCQYREPDWFDRCLKYRGLSQERASDFKKNLLFEKLPEIARSSLNYPHVTWYIEENIFYLCLRQKEKVIGFADHLRSFYEDSIKQNMCVLCLNNNYVHVNEEEEAQLNCEHHGTQGFVSQNQIDRIFSKYLENRFLVTNHGI